jgi:hypothetical protein
VGTWEACSSAFLKTTYSITLNENGSLGLVTKGSYYTGPGCTGNVRAELTQAPRVLSHAGQTTRTARTWNSTHYPEINITALFDDFVSTGTVGWTLVGPDVYEAVPWLPILHPKSRGWLTVLPSPGFSSTRPQRSVVQGWRSDVLLPSRASTHLHDGRHPISESELARAPAPPQQKPPPGGFFMRARNSGGNRGTNSGLIRYWRGHVVCLNDFVTSHHLGACNDRP